MGTAVRPRRQATAERWRAALQRAKADGLSLYRIAGTGQAVVTSGRHGATVYATDGVGCECEAAMLGGDPVCKHRALYWFDRGVLDDAAVHGPCAWCHDGMMIEWQVDGRHVATTGGAHPVANPRAVAVACPKCGRPPVVAPQPATPPAAPRLRVLMGGRDDRTAA